MKNIWKTIIDDFNVKKQAEELGLPVWQAPSVLFALMGFIIIAVMTSVYFISQKYNDPQVLVLSEVAVVTVLFTIGNFIIQSVEQAAKVNKMKSEFVSVASHQLKTPLAEISWEIELLLSKNQEGLNEKQLDLIMRICKSNERMGRLVNDLLDVARIEQGKLALVKEKFNIVEIANKVVENNRILAQANNVQILINKNKDIPEIYADRRRIGVVFENLVSNAIKYIKNKGTVKISFSRVGNKVIACVKDTGIGIPNNEHNSIFEKFFRSGKVVRYQVAGTGLGLYIAKNIIDQSGGRIWFDSKEGEGSTFCFSIPIDLKK